MIRSFQNDQILRSNATKLRRTIKTHAAKNFNQGYSITASYERTLFSFDSSFSPSLFIIVTILENIWFASFIIIIEVVYSYCLVIILLVIHQYYIGVVYVTL